MSRSGHVGTSGVRLTFEQLSDEWADSQIEVDGTQGCLRSLVRLKQEHPHLKIILSVGGGGQGSSSFSDVASDPLRRDTFARTALELVTAFGLDGIDGTRKTTGLATTVAGDVKILTLRQWTGNIRRTLSKGSTTSCSSPPSGLICRPHSMS